MNVVYRRKIKNRKKNTSFQHPLNSKVACLTILIMLCDGFEINPGSKTISQKGFSVCHWNLNSIFAHNFVKNSSPFWI